MPASAPRSSADPRATAGRGVDAHRPGPTGGSPNGRPPVPRLESREAAVAAADELAARWRRGALARDRADGPDHAALAALRDSGLLGIVVPADLGGLDAGARTIADVARILGSGDAALAQQLQGHVGNVHLAARATPAVRSWILGEVLDGGARFGNANAELGTPPVGRPWRTTVQVDGAHAVLDGEKAYATGSSTAQWLAVPAATADGDTRVALLPRETAGVTVDEQWDAFGQRATFSGRARFDRVRLPVGQLVALWGSPDATEARTLLSQIVHPALEVGIAEAVVAGPWPADVRSRPGFARVVADVAMTRALLDRVAAQIDALGADADAERVADAGIALHAIKALAYRGSVRAADAAAAWVGDDGDARDRIELLWRNARTHSVHDPGRWSYHHVGRHVLTGRHPASRIPGAPPRRDPETDPGPRVADGRAVAAVHDLALGLHADELRGAVADAERARGALRAAAELIATRPRAWPEAGVERAADEPFAALRFGELAVALEALDALLVEAADELRAHGERPSPVVAVVRARLQVDRWARRIVSDALEIAGASALTRARGLDGYWRGLLDGARGRSSRWEWADLAALAAPRAADARRSA